MMLMMMIDDSDNGCDDYDDSSYDGDGGDFNRNKFIEWKHVTFEGS